MSEAGEEMDIRNCRIYELPLNGASLKYASGQKYATTHGRKSLLVLTDEEPSVKCRAIEEGNALDERETAWAFEAVADIVRESADTDSKRQIAQFLVRLEKELEKAKAKQEGGGKNGG